MMNTIVIKEYDELHIKDKRDITKNAISKEDAISLQSIIMDEEPVFKWGFKKLIAQHWVGTISLGDLNIEILPKLYGSVSEEQLRAVLTRIILVSHQKPSAREIPGSTKLDKNSLIEILIDTFLSSLEKYVQEGLRHSYKKIEKNINRVKGTIVFNKQFSRNLLKPAKFWCRYSMFTADNDINQFFKLCLNTMNIVSNDPSNKCRIKYLLPTFSDFTTINKEKALLKDITFNSTNQNAKESYTYGKLFLKSIFSTLNAGNTPINMMLFDMNALFELFIFRVTRIVYKNRVSYQMRGNYLLERDSDGKKHIALRPDITIKVDNDSYSVIDTKWKVPKTFSKESDVYQMNSYSTSIDKVREIILLYPLVYNKRMIDDYHFIDSNGIKRPLKIRTIDLMKCLEWRTFLNEFPEAIK